MPTIVGCCGFECGDAVNATNSNGHYWTSGGVGTMTVSKSIFRSGTRSLRLQASGAETGADCYTQFALGFDLGNQLDRVIQAFVYFATLPNADVYLGSWGSLGLCYHVSSGEFRTYTGTTVGPATGIVPTTGVWYRLDMRLSSSGGVGTFSSRVDGRILPDQTGTSSGTDGWRPSCQSLDGATNVTFDIYWDDITNSHTAADYPLPVMASFAVIPNRDGQHNTLLGNFKAGNRANTTAVNVTDATRNVFRYINSISKVTGGGGDEDNTALINQTTAEALGYVEVLFGTKADPRLVPAYVAVMGFLEAATSATMNVSVKVVDAGTETLVINATALSGAGLADGYGVELRTTPTGALPWTRPRLDDLRMRFGYSSDATPDVYWRNCTLEVGFYQPVTVLRRGFSLGQRIG